MLFINYIIINYIIIYYYLNFNFNHTFSKRYLMLIGLYKIKSI